MKNYYEIKTVADSTLDVDAKSRRVKVVLNKTGVKDFDKDIVDKSAFNKTIAERGPMAKNLIWHLTDHNPSLKSAVGKFSELSMQSGDLVGVTNIPQTSWGNDVLTFYKSGQINQHSIGFKTIKDEPADKQDTRLIKEVMLYEGSAVLWGANEFTPTLEAGKSFSKEDLQTKYFALKKEMNSGNYTDEFFQIIDSQLKQIEQLIIGQTATKPEDKTSTQPELSVNGSKAFADSLYLLTLKHF
jgi:HK97 family phage prohead protease